LGFACRPNKAVPADQGLGALLKLDAASAITIDHVVVGVVVLTVDTSIDCVTAKTNAAATMPIGAIQAKGVVVAPCAKTG